MIFKKWKKKEAAVDKKLQELETTVLSDQDYKDSEKVEKYVVERLEQMIELTKEIEDGKAEYKMVTAYLNDIQTLENLPEEERSKITEIATNVVQLNRARTEFLKSSKKMSDAQFSHFQQEEKEIPDAIKRLLANETYRDTLKKDMKYLEREKSEWVLRREYLWHQQRSLKNVLYVAVGIAATAAVVIAILQFGFEIDCGYIWPIFAFLTAVTICALYIKIQNDEKEYAESERCLNKAIVLQNKVKLKYVGVENAVEYTCEKYHVGSGQELSQCWDCYMEAVREKEKYQKTNEDLDYFNARLIRELSKYPMHDARVWITQAIALVDPKEMVEVKHDLINRRQKLRQRIEYHLSIIKEQKSETEKLMDKVGDMRPRMEEILSAVDKLSEAM
ncbi:MAG: hypothetical protein PUB98_09405 [Clostridiales bacterium]|nr:hypothetical protein [Clostridiales bacterium]